MTRLTGAKHACWQQSCCPTRHLLHIYMHMHICRVNGLRTTYTDGQWPWSSTYCRPVTPCNALVQVIFADDAYTYSTTNSTTMSTWPVSGPRKQTVAVAALNASHPLEMLTTATNIITLRSKLNWIGESSTLLGIISGALCC